MKKTFYISHNVEVIHVKAKGNVSLYFVKNVNNFSDIRTLIGWWMAVCNKILFKIAISASSGARIRDR